MREGVRVWHMQVWFEFGDIRIIRESDDWHDTSYVDTWDMSPSETVRTKDEIQSKVQSEGVWTYTSQWRRDRNSPWVDADSISDCVGELDAGYRTDILRAALAERAEDISLLAKYG